MSIASLLVDPVLRLRLLVAVCLPLALSGAALGQSDSPAPRASDTITPHTVVSGETLSSITQSYLGSAFLWKENWRLNPQVRDPDLLRIGEELRIISERRLPKRTAEVWQMRRIVEKRPPESWELSHEGDFLEKGQALRTRERSSASIRFDDDTLLNLKEETLVVLREIGQSLRGVRRETIAIEQGTADLRAAPASQNRASEIKILVGDAETSIESSESSQNLSRLRRDLSDSSSAVMIYEGSSRVSAGGREVDVAAGMGTSVADGQAPTPPEPLLSRPEPLAPQMQESINYGNPAFRWDSIDGAETYAIEICETNDCGRVLSRARGLTETEYRPSGLPEGTLFWRVRGVSSTDLDGYPSMVGSILVTSSDPDNAPPALNLEIVEGGGRWLNDDHALLNSTGGLRALTSDDVSGVTLAEFRWNQGEWSELTTELLTLPSNSAHTLEIRLEDRSEKTSGRTLQVSPLPRPEPPTLLLRGETVEPSVTTPPPLD